QTRQDMVRSNRKSILNRWIFTLVIRIVSWLVASCVSFSIIWRKACHQHGEPEVKQLNPALLCWTWQGKLLCDRFDQAIKLDGVGTESAYTLCQLFGRHCIFIEHKAETLFIKIQSLDFCVPCLFGRQFARERGVSCGQLLQ